MLKGAWESADPVIKMIIFLGLILVCSAIFSIGGVALCSVIFGTDILTTTMAISNLSDPQSVAVLKFLQIASQMGMMIFPALIAAWLFAGKPLRFLSADKTGGFVNYLLVLVMALAAAPLINYLIELNSHLQLPEALKALEQKMRDMEDEAAKITEVFLNMKAEKDLWVNLLMIGLLPAIGEEFLFRGILQRLLSDMTKNKHLAIWITAILFSAIHMQFFGFVPRMLLGVFFGYLLVWTGSIWIPVFAHFVNNGAAVLFAYLQQHHGLGVNPDTIGTQSGQGWMVLISLLILGGGMLFIGRRESTQETAG